MKAKKPTKPKPVKELVIDRRKWLRGRERAGASYLLQPKTGKMCCMGFYGRALGVPRAKLLGVPLPVSPASYDAQICPADVSRKWPPWLFRTIAPGEQMRDVLAEANDNAPRTEEEREKLVARIFLRNGVRVRFIR